MEQHLFLSLCPCQSIQAPRQSWAQPYTLLPEARVAVRRRWIEWWGPGPQQEPHLVCAQLAQDPSGLLGGTHHPLPAIFGTWCLPGMAWDLRTQVCCLQAYLLSFLPLWTYSGRYPMESVTHGQLTGASDPCPHGLTCTKQAGELERGELLCTFSWICIGNAGLERT